jgi:GH35 family endo-1,4-beta-xylanase
MGFLQDELLNLIPVFMKKDSSVIKSAEIFIPYYFITVFLLLFIGSEKARSLNKEPDAEINSDSLKGLKYVYRDFFPMGVAVAPGSLSGPQSALILKHFGSLTAENAMKPALIHPEENRYSWDNADVIVNFAVANNLLMRGHTLCWHKQTAAWMFKDASGNAVKKEILLSRLKEHIKQVVTRYKGKVYAWDVVNEAIDDDDSRFFRESEWFKICGEEYIAQAFQWAHEADPADNVFTPEREQKQLEKYKMVFRVFRDYKNVISGVTFWNVSDNRSWLDNFPVRGRKNYPLLFDENLKPKKAYWEVVNW